MRRGFPLRPLKGSAGHHYDWEKRWDPSPYLSAIIIVLKPGTNYGYFFFFSDFTNGLLFQAILAQGFFIS